MKFRTKPFEIEAYQFNDEPNDYNRLSYFTENQFWSVGVEDRGDDPDIIAEVYDKLHSTWVGVKKGQWIIKGNKGEFYPCDDEIFKAKYEPVVDENQYADGHTYDRT